MVCCRLLGGVGLHESEASRFNKFKVEVEDDEPVEAEEAAAEV